MHLSFVAKAVDQLEVSVIVPQTVQGQRLRARPLILNGNNFVLMFF